MTYKKTTNRAIFIAKELLSTTVGNNYARDFERRRGDELRATGVYIVVNEDREQ
jgi:hypothetical protein